MGSFRHDLPTIAQHTCYVLIHCLHAWEQPLAVVFPGPIPFVYERFDFHLVTFVSVLRELHGKSTDRLTYGSRNEF